MLGLKLNHVSKRGHWRKNKHLGRVQFCVGCIIVEKRVSLSHVPKLLLRSLCVACNKDTSTLNSYRDTIFTVNCCFVAQAINYDHCNPENMTLYARCWQHISDSGTEVIHLNRIASFWYSVLSISLSFPTQILYAKPHGVTRPYLHRYFISLYRGIPEKRDLRLNINRRRTLSTFI